MRRSVLLLLVLLAASPAFAQEDPAQLFQVVLLRASRTGPEDTSDVPKAAQKALADIRDFLPFKHYQLLDTAMIRLAATREGKLELEPYRIQMKFHPDTKGSVHVRQFDVMLSRKGAPLPPGATPEPIRPLISTQFSMAKGETVVVGSSKINGNEALVVLLTALPGK